MCGITGVLLTTNAPQRPSEVIQKMTGAITHRGTDDEGYVFIHRAFGVGKAFSGIDSPNEVSETQSRINSSLLDLDNLQADLTLGHRRFAIISPTSDGHQPFWDAKRQICVVLNGEIYNYLEVREELNAIGHQFRTATDTEVLVEAYLAWGARCFEKLNGMWALALYDFNRKELILCRDRTGERPLYWVRRPEGIYFASEIKALLALENVKDDLKVNSDSVYNFLYLATSDLDERTFFEGIESLPTATIVRIGLDSQVHYRRYWQPPGQRLSESESRAVPELCEELRCLLQDSVKLRLRADVPINVALSGGMDSSSVVAMAADVLGSGVDTYTVRFKEEEWNEWPYADAVARRFQVHNFVIDPPDEWVWGYMERFVYSMEEPFHAPDLLPDHVIRRILASRGIRVSLSGIGGDELFAGYEYHRRLRALDLKRAGKLSEGIKELIFASDTSPLPAISKMIQGKLLSKIKKSENGQANFMLQALGLAKQPKLRELPESLEARLRSDLAWSLLPYWLRAGDKSSMAIPIEVRYPFLDHRLIEFAARLPVTYLLRDGWSKWLLRKAMADVLPDSVVWRRKKMGFPFPIVHWLKSAISELKLIFSTMDNPYLSREFWAQSLEIAIATDPWFVWRVLSFELWHRRFFRGMSALPESIKRKGFSISQPAAAS